MLQNLTNQLKSLQKKTIKIRAKGNYPKGLEVQKVAKWQNDGTERITPAHFVEDAEKNNLKWKRVLDSAVDGYLEGDNGALMPAAARIAKDIGIECDRIDTGQLKTSFEPIIDES